MKKILIITLLILVSIIKISKAVENSEFPKWINELHSNAVKTLQVKVNISHINLPDSIEEGKYFVFCLKGEGKLKTIPDPFEAMHKMFSSNGWKCIIKYDADGPGSSSFAYEKGNYFCNILVETDSNCDDEETGHVPSKFRFEIYCREK